jgi:hypothetical protein
MRRAITGKSFNWFFPNQYYKLLNADCVHHGLRYKQGLNIDPIRFSGHPCVAGGLYFTDVQFIPFWAKVIPSYTHFCPVYIPDDAWVLTEETKSKASMLLIDLSKKRLITDFFKFAELDENSDDLTEFTDDPNYIIGVDDSPSRNDSTIRPTFSILYPPSCSTTILPANRLLMT